MKEEIFLNTLSELKGYKIGLYINNGQFTEGYLLDVKKDHLVVETETVIHYVALDQIQAFSKNAKLSMKKEINIPYENKPLFIDLLKEFRYHWVTINCISNQKFTGLLSIISVDNVRLINEDEIIYIQKSFISKIMEGVHESLEKESKIDSSSEQVHGLPEDSNRVMEASIKSENKETTQSDSHIPNDSDNNVEKQEQDHIFLSKAPNLAPKNENTSVHSEISLISSQDSNKSTSVNKETIQSDSHIPNDSDNNVEKQEQDHIFLSKAPNLAPKNENTSVHSEVSLISSPDSNKSPIEDRNPEEPEYQDLHTSPHEQIEEQCLILQESELLANEGAPIFGKTPSIQSFLETGCLDYHGYSFPLNRKCKFHKRQNNLIQSTMAGNRITETGHQNGLDDSFTNDEKRRFKTQDQLSEKQQQNPVVREMDSNDAVNQLTVSHKPIPDKQKNELNTEKEEICVNQLQPQNNQKMDIKEQKLLLEKQYLALMKHAKKMYQQLKNERLHGQ